MATDPIRAALSSCRLTLDGLAQRAEISRHTLKAYQVGSRRSTPQAREKVAGALERHAEEVERAARELRRIARD